MTRFDLTFKGTILPDHDPQTVKEAFAELFTIKDPFVLEQMFSGDTFVVRSNLDRKSAADYFRKVVELGGQAELVASNLVDQVGVENNGQVTATVVASGQAIGGSRNGEILVQDDDYIDQSWPVGGTRDARAAEAERLLESDDPEVIARAAERERLRMALTELRLARDSAEAAAASELARLQDEQLKSREQFETELARVRVMREQASEKGQDALASLDQKIQDTLDHYATRIQQLEREQQEKNEEADLALEKLIEASKNTEEQLLGEAEKLESDRADISTRADESIAKLEQLIEETRRQAEADIDEIDKLLQENLETRENHEEAFAVQREDILHQSAENSDLMQAQLEESRTDHDELVSTLAAEREQEQQKNQDKVAQLEEMEGEVELRWSGELGRLEQLVKQTQRELEERLGSLVADEVTLRQELNSILD